ncbi:MAG: GDSL-type esterase/lipase family protein [Bacteroides sp.]|nr:GDSL-type esterase/lipase family protein [Bacteroides sp.]
MARKKFDGISAAIVVLNILIVGVIITLCVLIYLYMSGQLGDADVANLGQTAETPAVLTTTPVSVATFETSTTTAPTTTPEETAPEEETTTSDALTAVETDNYDPAFFTDDLFIGDSISTGLLNYGYLNADQVFAAIGLNPDSALSEEIDGETCIARAEAKQPKRIYIMLGSNGLAYMGNTYMIGKMETLVESLKEVSPESYIYILSIPPVTKAHEEEGTETMAMITGYNKLLKDLADDLAVVYLDLCSELENSAGYFSDAYAEADGMHFLGAAYKKMLSFLQKSIQA